MKCFFRSLQCCAQDQGGEYIGVVLAFVVVSLKQSVPYVFKPYLKYLSTLPGYRNKWKEM